MQVSLQLWTATVTRISLLFCLMGQHMSLAVLNTEVLRPNIGFIALFELLLQLLYRLNRGFSLLHPGPVAVSA
jgi:hypothetical protein